MKGLLLLTFVFFQTICFSQNSSKSLLDAVFLKAKETSMYTSIINWDSLQVKVYSKAKNAQNVNDLTPAFNVLLNGLKDKHGKIINAKTYQLLANFNAFDKLNSSDTRERDSETWSIVNDTASHFNYKILDKNIGYLKIVGIAPNVNIEAESKRIRNAVVKIANLGVEKWIIDLRYNGGGNMHPMVAGIAPLIGDGKVGGLINLMKEPLFDWEIKNSNFVYGGYQAVDLPNTLKFEKPQKIAVLTSRWTVSSGEILATCFKGRPNTLFIGEATGGYTTNNSWEVVNDEVIVVISTGIYCDRNGKSYPDNIPVDKEIPFEVVYKIENDKGILEAISWLKN